MSAEPSNVRLVGFENDAGLGDLLAKFGLHPDYKEMLPDHLLGILRQQHPKIAIESIDLLAAPTCRIGGMENAQNETLVTVQTLEAPIDIRCTILVGNARFALDLQLVLIGEGIDSSPTLRSDMFVKAERRI